MKLILCSLIILMYLSSLASAGSTFFDDPNDAFIMGKTSAASNAAPTSQQTGQSNAGGSFCPAGFNFTGEKCINVSSSNGLNTSKKINESSIVVPPEAEQEDEKNKTEEVGESQLTIEKTDAISAKMDNKKLLYKVLVGIIVLVVVCILFLLKRKKRPPLLQSIRKF